MIVPGELGVLVADEVFSGEELRSGDVRQQHHSLFADENGAVVRHALIGVGRERARSGLRPPSHQIRGSVGPAVNSVAGNS